MIYSWISVEAFEIFHNAIMQLKGIPNEHTTAYTDYQKISETDIRAFVRLEDAALLPDLVGTESEPHIEASTL